MLAGRRRGSRGSNVGIRSNGHHGHWYNEFRIVQHRQQFQWERFHDGSGRCPGDRRHSDTGDIGNGC